MAIDDQDFPQMTALWNWFERAGSLKRRYWSREGSAWLQTLLLNAL